MNTHPFSTNGRRVAFGHNAAISDSRERRRSAGTPRSQPRRPAGASPGILRRSRIVWLALGLAASTSLPGFGAATPIALETAALRFSLFPDTGRYEIRDKQSGGLWRSNPYQARFGEVTLNVDGGRQTRPLGPCEATRAGDRLELTFRPVPDRLGLVLRVTVRSAAANILEVAYAPEAPLGVESIRLLDDALWISDTAKGYALVPVREGLLIPADSGLAFTQRFGTYDYEGCHMAMAGLVREGAAALLTWDDPYTTLELRSMLTNASWAGGQQVLSASLSCRKSARSFRLHLLGKGDHVTVAQAYRRVAAEKGWLVTWDEKLKGHPERARYFGASNFKLWTLLARRMSEDSRREESVKVNWTFDEAAQVAEHLKKDLQLDKVLFILGGWIHRGYDSQHPDILPPAPECGGEAAFTAACRRIRALGYLLCLHDNYQDIYRDSPSWNEDLIQKTADGKLAVGGRWLGGRAYITCSKQALELAKRPQNLPAVKRLSEADSYFIDTTYAAGLQECFDPNHPLTKLDDMKWKQALSDYARELFGSFGSECGREWAVPHADFFEGLTGVSGRSYHNLDPTKLGAVVVPLFELVYHDCLALYGKYGYAAEQAAEYVLHHLVIGRPLHYHSVPPHLYWKNLPPPEPEPLAVRPAIEELKQTGPRRFSVTYRWEVQKPVTNGWRVFVHFTDSQDRICFQNDHEPTPPPSRWRLGEVRQGPFTVTVPENQKGVFNIYMGLFSSAGLQRAPLADARSGERRVLVGRLRVVGEQIQFEPPNHSPARGAGDRAVFVRADHGWAEGLHPLDRFVKNTHEILSPLHEITARLPLTHHAFLTPDRKVQRSVFGQGAQAVEVIVNAGAGEYRHISRLGGEVLLPPYGFLIESPKFVAFHARSWDGLRYEDPPLFTLRSLDGRPVATTTSLRVFHGFGDERLNVRRTPQRVSRERLLSIPADTAVPGRGR